MKKYNKKFWKEQYSNKENIKKWFKNFITFYTICPDINQIKKDFLKGEKKEIEIIFNNKKEQIGIYNYVCNIINELKEDYI